MQQPVAQLLGVAPKLTDDLEQPQLDEAVRLLDALNHPLSSGDIAALMSVLPRDGDTAHGLNWTILHAIEAAPSWPVWDLLGEQDHEWVEIFRIRLENAGIQR